MSKAATNNTNTIIARVPRRELFAAAALAGILSDAAFSMGSVGDVASRAFQIAKELDARFTAEEEQG